MQSLSYSFQHFLHPLYLWLDTTFGTVQKWSLRPLLDSPKGGVNIGISLYVRNDVSKANQATECRKKQLDLLLKMDGGWHSGRKFCLIKVTYFTCPSKCSKRNKKIPKPNSHAKDKAQLSLGCIHLSTFSLRSLMLNGHNTDLTVRYLGHFRIVWNNSFLNFLWFYNIPWQLYQTLKTVTLICILFLYPEPSIYVTIEATDPTSNIIQQGLVMS